MELCDVALFGLIREGVGQAKVEGVDGLTEVLCEGCL